MLMIGSSEKVSIHQVANINHERGETVDLQWWVFAGDVVLLHWVFGADGHGHIETDQGATRFCQTRGNSMLCDLYTPQVVWINRTRRCLGGWCLVKLADYSL